MKTITKQQLLRRNLEELQQSLLAEIMDFCKDYVESNIEALSPLELAKIVDKLYKEIFSNPTLYLKRPYSWEQNSKSHKASKPKSKSLSNSSLIDIDRLKNYLTTKSLVLVN